MRSSDRARRPSPGFTLLEVLAAAIIMAMFYGVLTAKGVEGFVLEGDADRRLRASLVADRWLAEVETEMSLGTPPVLGTREIDEDEYRVRIETAPLELPMERLQPEPRRGAPAPPPVAELFDARGRRGEPPLRTITITVGWSDGLSDHEVRRTTFLLDEEAVAAALQRAGLGLEAGGEGEDVEP